MGDVFREEDGRGIKFDGIMTGLFRGITKKGKHFRSSTSQAWVDRVYYLQDVIIIVCADKNEFETGDAFLQSARSYDIACEVMRESDPKAVQSGLPAFLLAINGPMLTISGGFHDHGTVVVEPLCPPLLMLADMDRVNGRVIRLTHHMYAIKKCLGKLLPSSPESASMTKVPKKGCPRVFPSFTDTEGNSHNIEFICPFNEEDHPLIFKAIAHIGEDTRPVIVKIVYNRYGEEVHRVLAERGMAPRLYGVKKLEGGPVMVVMEDLSVNREWTTLYSIIPQGINAPRNDVIREKVHPRLLEIVKTLNTHGFVHGDIRTNNIMVKTRKEEECFLIDFEWAGKAGEVKYPFDVNPSATTTGVPGGLIQPEHDNYMVAQILRKT